MLHPQLEASDFLTFVCVCENEWEKGEETLCKSYANDDVLFFSNNQG